MDLHQNKNNGKRFYEGTARVTMLMNHKDNDNYRNWDNHDNGNNGDNWDIVGHTVVFLNGSLLLLCYVVNVMFIFAVCCSCPMFEGLSAT